MGLIIGFFAALIVVFLLGYITVKKTVFGEVLIAISLILILLATFLYFQKDNREEKKKQKIPVEQIQLSDISYGLAYGNYYKLTANIKNSSSRYRLQSVLLDVSFYQCKTESSSFENCQLLEKRQHNVDTRLASGKTEKIETYLLLNDTLTQQNIPVKERGAVRWQIKIATGTAR